MSLFFTVSGLRGIVFYSLTPEYVLRVASSFSELFQVKGIIVGRDTRPSGRALFHSVASGILSKGKSVFDGKIAPTPTIVYSVRLRNKEVGGIVITASHNPPEWNALKFIHPEGRFLFENEIERLKKEVGFFSWDFLGNNIGSLSEINPISEHIEGILRNEFVLVDEIREKRFRVGVDAGGGAGTEALPLLLLRLGCEVYSVDKSPGEFSRPFEVNIENVSQFGRFVWEKNLDIGFAMDADGDRLIIVSKDGEVLSEEDTLPICLYYLLSKKKSDVVTNLSTTEHVEDVAERFNVNVFRTKVGEANVVSKMIETDSLFGGEGNGGLIVKEFNMTRDALFASAIVLSFLTQVGDSREFKKLFRPRYRKKIKVKITERKIPSRLEELLTSMDYNEINNEDGIRLKTLEGFIHVRVSNTEPVVRIIMESKEKEVLNKWENMIKDAL